MIKIICYSHFTCEYLDVYQHNLIQLDSFVFLMKNFMHNQDYIYYIQYSVHTFNDFEIPYVPLPFPFLSLSRYKDYLIFSFLIVIIQRLIT